MDCFHRFDFKKKIIPLILLKEQYRNHRVVGQKPRKDLPNSKFPKNRYFSNKILRISNRRNLKISNKATRQRDRKLYHTVPLYPIGIKRKPLSALFREIYISAFLLRPRIPPHFVQKRRQTRRVFPLIRGKLGKKGQDKGDIARISFSTPLDGRNVFRGHAESSGSVSSTFILPLLRFLLLESLLDQTICYGGWSIEGLVIRLVASVLEG